MVFEMQELLVSLKQVLGTDFKRGLFPLIDTLLEERYNAFFVFLKLLHLLGSCFSLSSRPSVMYNSLCHSIYLQILTYVIYPLFFLSGF